MVVQEREPERLLQSMLQALSRKGARIDHALFVPPDSLYSKPTASTEDEAGRDLTWQTKLRDTWDSLLPPLAAGRPQVLLTFVPQSNSCPLSLAWPGICCA